MELRPITQFFTWTDEDLMRFPPLPHPTNVLELKDGEEIELRFTRRELYRTEISPRFPGAPPIKRIIALRGWLHPDYKYRGLPFVDITATKLVSQVVPFFDIVNFDKAILKIKKIGEPPKAEFSVGYIMVE